MAGPHYVTKCLLTKFVGETHLFELVKFTGTIDPRKLEKAGAEVGIWAEKIEAGIMQDMDTDGHRVLRSLFRDTELSLCHSDKTILKQWLFFFMIRSPAHRELCRKLSDSGLINRTHQQNFRNNRNTLILNRERCLEEARQRDPALYAEKCRIYGKEAVDAEIMRRWNDQFFTGNIGNAQDGIGLYHQMLKSGNFKNYVKEISDMKWVWLHTAGDFIIGDNPFCRCDSKTGALAHHLQSESLEIFFPLGRKLCLWMHRRKRRVTELTIDDVQTTELNRRQLVVAAAKLWGPTTEALKIAGSTMTSSPIP